MADSTARLGIWITGIALVLGALVAVSSPALVPRSAVRTASWLFLLTGMVWAWWASRSVALMLDLFIAVTAVWLFAGRTGASDPALRLHALVLGILAVLGYRLPARLAVPVVWVAGVAWLAVGLRTPVAGFGWVHAWVGLSSLAMLAVFTSVVRANRGTARRCVDVIVSSGSGNTAHLASEFADGIRAAGGAVTVHRLLHYHTFRPTLDGDALAVAFPIYGCKPPWPLLVYLLGRLPRGRGKPAFVLYTCVGAAENAGVLCWLLLTLKGYRVVGRDWGVYPLNVPTFRLGPTRLWTWVDRLLPRPSDVRSVREAGAAFAAGRLAGIPFVFCLSPAFLGGILADHKWIDTVLYRNHVFRRRCNQCGLCVACCPMDRIRFVGEYPRGKGACMICLACVNNCPPRAMHLWGWTEYGVQYRSRFRRHVLAGLKLRGRTRGRASGATERAGP